jgi:hypothetical protein
VFRCLLSPDVEVDLNLEETIGCSSDDEGSSIVPLPPTLVLDQTKLALFGLQHVKFHVVKSFLWSLCNRGLGDVAGVHEHWMSIANCICSEEGRDLTTRRWKPALRETQAIDSEPAEVHVVASEETAEERAQAAEERAQAAEERAQAAEEQLRVSHQRAQAAEEQLRVSHQRAEAAEEQLRATRQRAEAVEKQFRATSQRAYSAEVKLRAARVKAAEQKFGATCVLRRKRGSCR